MSSTTRPTPDGSSLRQTLAVLTAAAEDLGFVQSSEGDLGRLLRLLVASRPGGSFLELGTGVGYGAAWLLDGMDADSRLVSVELEDDLQRIARATFDDDPRVEWVLGDGSEWLREAVARPACRQSAPKGAPEPQLTITGRRPEVSSNAAVEA